MSYGEDPSKQKDNNRLTAKLAQDGFVRRLCEAYENQALPKKKTAASALNRDSSPIDSFLKQNDGDKFFNDPFQENLYSQIRNENLNKNQLLRQYCQEEFNVLEPLQKDRLYIDEVK